MSETLQGQFERALIAEMESLRRFAMHRVKNQALAEDLVQETLLRAWYKRDGFELGTNLRAWLFTILKNAHLNHVRKVRWESVGLASDIEITRCQEASQHHHMELVDIDAALSRLPDKQRMVLIAIGAGGKTYEEFAAMHDCPVGTVRSRLSRARTAMAALLEG